MEQINEKKFSINGNEINKYNLNFGSYNTNKKSTLYETEKLILCKSYDSFIAVFDKSKKILIVDYETFKTSNTTRKHFDNFIYHIGSKIINTSYYMDIMEDIKIIYLTEYEFNKELIKTFLNFGELENKITEYNKLYELEKKHIQYYLNIANVEKDLKLFENSINSTTDNNEYIKNMEVIEKETEYLKTRIKENLLLQYDNKIFQSNIKVTITYNNKKTKVLAIKSKLISKIGLSYCNYNTKELDSYTCYYCY